MPKRGWVLLVVLLALTGILLLYKQYVPWATGLTEGELRATPVARMATPAGARLVDERFRKDLVERVKRGAQSASDAAEEIESS